MTHPFVDDASLQYKGACLANWQVHSNLLSVVRQMHQDFDLNPPLPVQAAQPQPADAEQPAEVAIESQEEIKQEDPEPQPEDVAADEDQEESANTKIRTEEDRREHVERLMGSSSADRQAEFKEYLVNSLGSLSLTELERLSEDPEYAEDTVFSIQQYVKMCKVKDKLEDATLLKANENIKVAEQLEERLTAYNEVGHAAYETSKEKASELVDAVEAKKAELNLTRKDAAKVLKAAANAQYKASKAALQNFNKSGSELDDFMKEYLDARKAYYRNNEYLAIVQSAPEADN